MARNSPHNSCEEDEALSLCDLPLGLAENPISRNPQDDDPDPPETGEDKEFEFGSWVGSVPAEKEMCPADELFFEGQILPLRLSSSRAGSGSESMDHSSGLTSTSSRSSSLNSTSSASAASIAKTTPLYAFQTHPSPKPQVRASGGSRRSKKSSVWNLFRVGLVPTPEIGLQDLKARNGKKSSGRGHNGKNGPTRKLKNLNLSDTKDGDKGMRFSDKNSGFLRGCKCSVETVSSSVKKGCGGEGTSRAMQREEVKTKKTIKQKHDVSRRRASDWLKELSHANSPRHDETVALLA